MSKSLKAKNNNLNNIFTRELWGFTTLLFTTLISICVLGGDNFFRPLGKVVSNFMFGAFGIFVYPLLILGFVIGIALIICRSPFRGAVSGKIWSLSIITLLILSIIHLALTTNLIDSSSYGEYINKCYKLSESSIFDKAVGGGLISLYVYPLAKALSNGGSFILYGLAIIITTMFIFKNRLFGHFVKENNQDGAEVSTKKEEKPIEKQPMKAVNVEPTQNKVVETINAHSSRRLNVFNNDFSLKDNLSKEERAYNKLYNSSTIVVDKEEPKKTEVKNNRDYNKPQVSSGVVSEEINNSFVEDNSHIDENVYVPNGYKENKISESEDFYNNKINLDLVDDSISDENIVDQTIVKNSMLDENLTIKQKEVFTPKEEDTPIEDDDIVLDDEPQEMEETDDNPIDNMPLYYKYNAPSLDFLKNYDEFKNEDDIRIFDEEKSRIILNTIRVLGGFETQIVSIIHGPTVSRFDLAIPQDVQISRFYKLENDIQSRLAVTANIRVASVPGTPYVGIEIPNDKKEMVGLKSILKGDNFVNCKKNTLSFGVGKDIVGNNIVADMSDMPHLIVAGATGSGKSICLQSLIVSLLYKYSPEDLRLLIVDPKQVEFTVYSGIPHLLINDIVYDAKKTTSVLDWAIKEMEHRNNLMCSAIVQNIDEYNAQIDRRVQKKLPKILIILDEFADLMSEDKKGIEERIRRLAQKARSAGIYLLLAMQRPSTDIICGSIKNNFPSRISFQMSSHNDSQTIIGEKGAERLLGKGDMLYKPRTLNTPLRVQGAFVSMEEVKAVVRYIKDNNTCYFDEKALQFINNNGNVGNGNNIEDYGLSAREDNLDKRILIQSLRIAIEEKMISGSFLQRRLGIGYNKGAAIMDWMRSKGYIEKESGKNGKTVVLITREEFNKLYGG